jgi:hypothetical protein
MRIRGGRWLAPILCAAGLSPAAAQDDDARLRVWNAEKCRAYAEAWDSALLSRGTEGLGEAFLRGNEAFIASGCEAGRNICPDGPDETALADALTIAAMNMGAASTFPPFACR